MIKGVNKRIIEINSPESIYFEKAVFYLKAEVRELPAHVARREAESILNEYAPGIYGRNHNTAVGKRIIGGIAAAAALGIIAVLII